MALPPKSFEKNAVPTYRSIASKPNTAVSTGNDATIRMLVHSAVQVKMGIFIMPMPGARILMMVTSKLIPDSNVPTPASCSAQM